MNRPGTCWELGGAFLIATSRLTDLLTLLIRRMPGGGELSPRETPPTPLIYTSISLYTCFHPCSVPTWPFSDPHEVIVQLLVPVFNEYLLVATDPAGLLCSCRRIEQTKRKWLTSEVPLVRSGHAKKTSYCEHELLLMGGLKWKLCIWFPVTALTAQSVMSRRLKGLPWQPADWISLKAVVNLICKSPNGRSNEAVVRHVDFALADVNKSKPRQKHNPNCGRGSIPKRKLLSFPARPMCLRSVPLHINHYSTSHLGESVLALGLLSLTFFISARHSVDTACHPRWWIPAGMGRSSAAVCHNPSKDNSCL